MLDLNEPSSEPLLASAFQGNCSPSLPAAKLVVMSLVKRQITKIEGSTVERDDAPPC